MISIENIKELVNNHNIPYVYNNKKFIPRKTPVYYSGPFWDDLEIASAINSLLNGKWIVSGENVHKFEKKFSKMFNVKFSHMVNSGSSANLIEYIMLKNNNFLICRCSFKNTPFEYENAWINQVGNFDYVDIIAKYIIMLVNKNASGIINVGTELKTMHNLAKKTNTQVGYSFTPQNIPNNVTMNLSKMKKELNNI